MKKKGVYSVGKDGTRKILVYNNSILTINKNDSIVFKIKNKNLEYEIEFGFSQEGEKYSTTYWENPEKKYLRFQLHKWDSDTYVEIIVPVELAVPDSESKFLMKFRNTSTKKSKHRRFEISIWKEVPSE